MKFILPFKLKLDDDIPFLEEIASNMALIKNYVEKKGIEILADNDLEYNPYFPPNFYFFDIQKVRLEIDFKKYKEKPKFSIIIPTFNRKKTLPFVLHNLFRQDYPKSKYEIIVVDDGSSDKTSESIKKIKPSCNFKYFYWPRKKIAPKGSLKKIAKFYNRVGPARNIGIKHARGEIVLFNDADILPTRDCLKRHERYHHQYPNIIVRGFRMFLPKEFVPNFKRVENFISLEKISYPERMKRWQKIVCRMYYLSSPKDIRGSYRLVTANLSIRKKYLEKLGGFSRDFVFWGNEDIDLGFRLAKLGMKLVWDKNIKVYHLYHLRESGDELATLLTHWLGSNIHYRKYFDQRIYNIFNAIIMDYLNKSILS